MPECRMITCLPAHAHCLHSGTRLLVSHARRLACVNGINSQVAFAVHRTTAGFDAAERCWKTVTPALSGENEAITHDVEYMGVHLEPEANSSFVPDDFLVGQGISPRSESGYRLADIVALLTGQKALLMAEVIRLFLSRTIDCKESRPYPGFGQVFVREHFLCSDEAGNTSHHGTLEAIRQSTRT